MPSPPKSVSQIIELMKSEVDHIDWSALELTPAEKKLEVKERALKAAYRINLRSEHNSRLEALATSLEKELKRVSAPPEALNAVRNALAALKGGQWGSDFAVWMRKMKVKPESMYEPQESYAGCCAADMLMDPEARECLDALVSKKSAP